MGDRPGRGAGGPGGHGLDRRSLEPLHERVAQRGRETDLAAVRGVAHDVVDAGEVDERRAGTGEAREGPRILRGADGIAVAVDEEGRDVELAPRPGEVFALE